MYKVRIAILLIAVFILGIALTGSGLSDIIKMSGNVPDFNYESMQNIKKGDIVQGYIWNIEGCYANTTNTETTFGIETNSYVSAEYFLMPLVNDIDLKDELYITIVAKNQLDRDILYDINEATWEYYDGNENAVFPDMAIAAKVGKLGSEYEAFLVEAMLEAEYYPTEAEVRSHIIPYTLTIYNPKSAYTSLAIGLVIIAVFVVVGIIIFTKFKKENSGTFNASSENNSNDFTLESKPSENGFGESYTPPQPVPIPDIAQPLQPDEFFARTPKPAEPVSAPPKENPAVNVDVSDGNMSGLSTDGLFDDSDYTDNVNSNESDFID